MNWRYHLRKQLGQCTRCGHTAVAYQTLCSGCAEKQRRYSAEYRSRIRERRKRLKAAAIKKIKDAHFRGKP